MHPKPHVLGLSPGLPDPFEVEWSVVRSQLGSVLSLYLGCRGSAGVFRVGVLWVQGFNETGPVGVQV